MEAKTPVIGRVPERDDLLIRTFKTALFYLKFPKEFIERFPGLRVDTIANPEARLKHDGAEVCLSYVWKREAMVRDPDGEGSFDLKPELIQRNPNLRLGYLRPPR